MYYNVILLNYAFSEKILITNTRDVISFSEKSLNDIGQRSHESFPNLKFYEFEN